MKRLLFLLFMVWPVILFSQDLRPTERVNWINLSDSIRSAIFEDDLEWTSMNIIYVPIDGDIQTYINNADSGSTVVLASGVYTITDTIVVNKQINIRGQGSSGFVTSPVTPSHGTLITSSTAGVVAFQIDSSNVRIADLSINLTGAGSQAISTANNLVGVVFYNIDVIVNCTGTAQGFTVLGSDVVMRDLTFYITSSNNTASGVYFSNNSNTTQNAVVDAFNVTGTVQGGATYAYAFACRNVNHTDTITLNLSNSVCRVNPGTANDIAVISTSTVTNNSIVNAYMCTLNGADYDAYQTGTNQLNVGGSVLENAAIFGTINYRATMASGALIIDGSDLGTIIEDSIKAQEFPFAFDVPMALYTFNQGDSMMFVYLSSTDSIYTVIPIDKKFSIGDNVGGIGVVYVDSVALYFKGDASSAIDKLSFGQFSYYESSFSNTHDFGDDIACTGNNQTKTFDPFGSWTMPGDGVIVIKLVVSVNTYFKGWHYRVYGHVYKP